MKKILLVSAGIIVALLLTGKVSAASFDCSKAGTPFEKTICNNPMLSSMDDKLAQAYFSAKATTTNPDQLKADQISWIKSARNCGTDVGCIENTYKIRIAQLAPQQPAPIQTLALVAPQSNSQADACVTRKVNAFKREMGQDALIKWDILDEFRSDCEKNPNWQEQIVTQAPAQQNYKSNQPSNTSNSSNTSDSSDSGSVIFWLSAIVLLGGLFGTKPGRAWFKKNTNNYGRGVDLNSPEYFQRLKDSRDAHLNPSLNDKAIRHMLTHEFAKWQFESQEMNISSEEDFVRELTDWVEFQREDKDITMNDIRNEVPGKAEELEVAFNKIVAARTNPKEYEQAFLEHRLLITKGIRALTVPGGRPKTERAKEIAKAAAQQRSEVYAANEVARKEQVARDKENDREWAIKSHNSSVEYAKNQLQWAKNSGNRVDINRWQTELDALNAKKF